jgi:hypothetical protein
MKKSCIKCKNYNNQVITFKCLSCNNGSNFKVIEKFKTRTAYRKFVLGEWKE